MVFHAKVLPIFPLDRFDEIQYYPALDFVTLFRRKGFLMKNIVLCMVFVLLFSGQFVVAEQENRSTPSTPVYQTYPPSIPGQEPVPVSIDGPFLLFEIVICESPFEENGKMLAETLAERLKTMTVPVHGMLTEPKISDALKQLETEGKLTVLSRPQMMALNNQIASLMIGSSNKAMGVEITPRIVDDRIVTGLRLEKSEQDQLGRLCSIALTTNFALQDGVPLFMGGLLQSNSDSSKNEVSFCVTARKVHQKLFHSTPSERRVSYSTQSEPRTE